MDCIKIFSVVRIFCFSEQSGRKSVSKESEQTEGKKKSWETSRVYLTVKLSFTWGCVLNLWFSNRICESYKTLWWYWELLHGVCKQAWIQTSGLACLQDPQKQWWILKNLGTQVRYCFQQFFWNWALLLGSFQKVLFFGNTVHWINFSYFWYKGTNQMPLVVRSSMLLLCL